MLKSAITGLRTISGLRTRANITNQLSTNLPHSSKGHDIAFGSDTDFQSETTSEECERRTPVKLVLKRSNFAEIPYLPKPHIVCNSESVSIGYNGRDSESFCLFVTSVYEEVKFWKKNMFEIPSGDS